MHHYGASAFLFDDIKNGLHRSDANRLFLFYFVPPIRPPRSIPPPSTVPPTLPRRSMKPPHISPNCSPLKNAAILPGISLRIRLRNFSSASAKSVKKVFFAPSCTSYVALSSLPSRVTHFAPSYFEIVYVTTMRIFLFAFAPSPRSSGTGARASWPCRSPEYLS